MIGRSLKKYSTELGFKISHGVAYGKYKNYIVTLHEGETSVINPVYNKFFNVIQNTDSSVNFSASSINGNIASVSGLTINPVSTGKTQIIVSGAADRQLLK